MRLMWSSSSSVTGSWLNCSNNLLFTIFRIDPSILHMDMHSSVTLPQGLSTPVLSARKTRAVSPCFSIWTTFRTAPDGANICSDANVRFLFLWIVAVRGLVFVNTLFWCKASTWNWPAYYSLGVTHKSWKGDQSRLQWPKCWREDAKRISIKIMHGCLEVMNCLLILLHPHWLTLNMLHMKMLAFEVLLHNNLHSCNVFCIHCCCKQLLIVQNLHPPFLELGVQIHSCLNPKVKWLTDVVQPCHWLDKMVTDGGHFLIRKCREHSPNSLEITSHNHRCHMPLVQQQTVCQWQGFIGVFCMTSIKKSH